MSDKITDITTESVFDSLPVRAPDSHKGTFGRAMLICGSYSMAGAAIIAGRAAVHSGVGIADIVCPKSVYPIIAPAVPEAVFTPLHDDLAEEDMIRLSASLKKADSVLIGCGMGQSDYTRRLLYFVLENCRVPLIIDADGINCLCDCIDLLQSAICPIILTPHPGEMARLCGRSVGQTESERLEVAREFVSRHPVTLVLKGHHTIVMQESGFASINRCGNAGMACAGSGDMLSGITAALAAQGMNALQAARAAVHIHALSGDLSAERYSMAYTSPTTMISCLADVWKRFENASKGK